jgi:hypothetical protein
MAIDTDRMLRLLAAAEDLKDALRQICDYGRQAAARVREEGSPPAAEWEAFEAMCDPEKLLQSPILTLLAIEREKEHWTGTRLRRNLNKRELREKAKRESQEANDGE